MSVLNLPRLPWNRIIFFLEIFVILFYLTKNQFLTRKMVESLFRFVVRC